MQKDKEITDLGIIGNAKKRNFDDVSKEEDNDKNNKKNKI